MLSKEISQVATKLFGQFFYEFSQLFAGNGVTFCNSSTGVIIITAIGTARRLRDGYFGDHSVLTRLYDPCLCIDHSVFTGNDHIIARLCEQGLKNEGVFDGLLPGNSDVAAFVE